MIEDELKNFLQYVFQIVEGIERTTQGTVGVDFRECAQCGTTYGSFKKSGKLGCAECYATFSDYIAGALKNIHGTSEHKGKIPQSCGDKYADLITKRELEETRLLLKKAVEAEEFEEAARLRDIINSLQEKVGIE